MKIKIGFFIFFWWIVTWVTAQEYPRKNFNMGQLQNLFPIQKGDVNYEQLYESLFQLYQNPIDLNTCSRDELAATFVLSQTQINSFFEYKATAGKLLSVYELQAIPNFDLPSIYRLLPFVWVKPEGLSVEALKNAFDQLQSQFLLVRTSVDFEQSKGFSPPTATSKSRYLGSPFQQFIRYRWATPRDISLGFTLEKDAGETLVWQPSLYKYGADFSSFHFSIQNKGAWKSINLGDYQLQMGQGLVLSSGLFLGKGGETVLTTRRSHLGLRPYTSSIESNFFRGMATTYQFKQLEITGFYANNRRDANLKTTNTLSYVSSLQTSGLHRTTSEQADAASLGVQDMGLHLGYRSKTDLLHVGFSLLDTQFDKTLVKDTSKAYNKYEFLGKQNTILAGHYSYQLQNLSFFGEVAQSSSGGIGMVHGLISSWSKSLDYSLVFRHFDRNFHSFYGNAFGENTRNINETGLYLGLKYSPNKRWQTGAYVDVYRFPELKYLIARPSMGFDVMLRGIYTPNKLTTWTFQLQQEHKAKDVPTRLTKLDITTTTVRRNMMLAYDNQMGAGWQISSRLVASMFNYQGFAPSKGFALVQDVSRSFRRASISGRLAYFNTDDYDSRVYVYENEVQYAFAVPAYFDQGFRAYFLFEGKLTPKLTLWLRLSRTQLLNQSTIGSGLDEIPLPHRTDGRLQLRYVF